ncbi:MAG: hypothetical protein IPP74_14875 [Alphaproteobacteria bacterium]|nr:hypothetical protein [Alphaproteobacteria bacterium]
MTISVKVLAEGQLANAKGTLYTVPAATTSYVKFFSVYNAAATNQDVEIFVKAGSTSRQVAFISLAPRQSARVIDKDEALNLEAGDLIEGNSTDATSVDYVITGAEEA